MCVDFNCRGHQRGGIFIGARRCAVLGEEDSCCFDEMWLEVSSGGCVLKFSTNILGQCRYFRDIMRVVCRHFHEYTIEFCVKKIIIVVRKSSVACFGNEFF